MKKLVLATVLSMSFTGFAANAHDEKIKYAGDLEYASFCKAVVNNDQALFKSSLNRFVGELGSNRKQVLNRVLENDSVKCAGKGLVKFSSERNATEIVTFLNNQA
ncbi:hypothetical protein [Aliiglaciecola litoralis]|uniref:DUF3718 domain-containing protein n=1 Tax=Aliiglaciecola litoralis TaxID=582857 RepID=A0ABN1LPI1_9ALTE